MMWQKERQRELIIDTHGYSSPRDSDVEIVERKGLGHPDTICDALAEETCRALCHAYLEAFGAILHRNVDKILLCGERPTPRLAVARFWSLLRFTSGNLGLKAQKN